MPDATGERRQAQNLALRAAFDQLAVRIAESVGDGDAPGDDVARRSARATRSAVQACAQEARRLGIAPERFLVSLKQFFNRRPELQPDASRLEGRDAQRGPQVLLVTWAIEGYYSGAAEPARPPAD